MWKAKLPTMLAATMVAADEANMVDDLRIMANWSAFEEHVRLLQAGGCVPWLMTAEPTATPPRVSRMENFRHQPVRTAYRRQRPTRAVPSCLTRR